jgi:ATP-dependent exoDNAse (exonuclease V) alpha subunit
VESYVWKEFNPLDNAKLTSDQILSLKLLDPTGEISGAYRQIPLKLAYAITIHKSQGMTFDRMNIQLNRPLFAPFHVYIAVSRARNIRNIHLSRPISMKDYHIDQRAIDITLEHAKNALELQKKQKIIP